MEHPNDWHALANDALGGLDEIFDSPDLKVAAHLRLAGFMARTHRQLTREHVHLALARNGKAQAAIADAIRAAAADEFPHAGPLPERATRRLMHRLMDDMWFQRTRDEVLAYDSEDEYWEHRRCEREAQERVEAQAGPRRKVFIQPEGVVA
ncbi:hypothetical protein HII28_00430 [Planctomonas sp. JC2975]|uniref:hypothetical protein n=1 Tax=Planctomonas sp. JC2975 TaxID=2729626 RepID=UPI0014735BCA|nr:hypothetical protein [Planctomonas sp. JC2975]NNC10351.1 hypothetical protein [Planctomonas sp. JC2975]